MRKEFGEALARADNNGLTGKDMVALLGAGEEESKALFAKADEFRARFMGDEVHLRGIIEFSNFCRQNCLYCGLRRDNQNLTRYRMGPDEIYESAGRAAKLGCRTIVLQSGEDLSYSSGILVELLASLKKDFNVAITLSIGERSREEYLSFKEAGADRYLLKQETCDPVLFARLRPGTRLKDRIERLHWLKEMGYQTGSGNMVGLPGQGLKTLAADIELMRAMKLEMAGIGPFIPNKDTPLGGSPGGSMELTLKALATARLALPFSNLPATTSISTINPQGRIKALQCGANIIMPNMTPKKYRANYSLYPGKTGQDDTPEESYFRALEVVKKAGRRIGTGFGHAGR